MNLSEEIIKLLEKAMNEDTYFNPVIINGVLNSILEGCPEAGELISNELNGWACSMWRRYD